MTPTPDFHAMYLEQIDKKLDQLTAMQAAQSAKIEKLAVAVSEIRSKHRLIASLVGFIAGLIPAVISLIWGHR